MKRVRFLSIFVLFGVFASVIYAGVFAASSVKQVNVAGSISIPANILDVKIEGFYGENDTAQKGFDSTDTNNGGTWEIPASYLTFDISQVNDASQLSTYAPDIYLTLRITNSGSHTVKASFTKVVNDVENPVSIDGIYIRNTTNIIQASVVSGTNGVYSVQVDPWSSEGVASVAVIKLKFSLLQLVEEDISATFNYNFKLEEVAPVTP